MLHSETSSGWPLCSLLCSLAGPVLCGPVLWHTEYIACCVGGCLVCPYLCASSATRSLSFILPIPSLFVFSLAQKCSLPWNLLCYTLAGNYILSLWWKKASYFHLPWIIVIGVCVFFLSSSLDHHLLKDGSSFPLYPPPLGWINNFGTNGRGHFVRR